MAKPKVAQATSPRAADPARLEQQQQREAEDRRRREEAERRRREEEDAKRAKAEDEQRAQDAELAELFSRGGTPTEFKYSECFEFEAQCHLVADFTQWKPIPMKREGDNLDFTLTIPLPPGRTYFYYFQVDGKVEIDKKKPTGLGNGILCNKVAV
jgi:hypothetical protein